MAAISSPPLAPSTMPGWRPEEINPSSLQSLFIKKFTEFVAEYQKRRQARKLEDLKSGPWYASDYALGCKKWGQFKHLKFLIKKNALYHGLPPEGFDPLPDPSNVTGIEFWSYQIQKEILPTEGLKSIRRGRFSFIDCQGAIEVALYETIHEIFGTLRFNEIFSGTGEYPLRIHLDWTQTPLYFLGIITQKTLDPTHLQLETGDQVNFPNLPFYQYKHEQGEFGGLNVICISPSDAVEKQYIGFGTSSEGQTADQISDLLLAAFNEAPIDPSLILSKELDAHFQKVDQLTLTNSIEHARFQGITVEKAVFQKIIREITKSDSGYIPFCNRFRIKQIYKLMS
ncbi:MAG: hypothetical protein K2P51_02270 [Rhabdochlamydiaceae bacterium]|nr:hypothetical protein [Rhabdochlamydiaceae bacterium]